jgi:subtilisin-like proprotein convertase family protein
LQWDHPDLKDNYRPSLSFDVNFNDTDPYPDEVSDDHGTRAAGVAAAGANRYCGVGTAYKAGLSGIRLLSSPSGSTDAEEAFAMIYKFNENMIYSNSWGPMDDGHTVQGPGTLAMKALEHGVANGRNGKGNIYVWSAGNGAFRQDQCNYDGWANSRYTICVASVDYYGNRPDYSENCSMVLITTPSGGGVFRKPNEDYVGITTTDLMGDRGVPGDCADNFGGTSASAPLAAGGIALILEANPELTWRNVQAILIETGMKVDPTADWAINGAGYSYSHWYGFGLFDAHAAVLLAQNWTTLPPERFLQAPVRIEKELPPNRTMSVSIDVTADFIIEHVRIFVKIDHPYRGNLRMILLSSSGMKSILAEPHQDFHADWVWEFGSLAYWGESTKGIWTLKVENTNGTTSGFFHTCTMKFYGH